MTQVAAPIPAQRGKPKRVGEAKTLGFPLTLEGCESQRRCLTWPSAGQAFHWAKRGRLFEELERRPRPRFSGEKPINPR
jgi:hypothetical protein